MEYELITVSVPVGSLVLTPLDSRNDSRVAFEKWIENQTPDHEKVIETHSNYLVTNKVK